MSRLAIIINVASHYRESIYTTLDHYYDCEWHFGINPQWRQMDISLLKNVKMHKVVGHRPYYLKGGLRLALRKDISAFLMLGEIGFLTPWYITLVSKIIHPKRKLYYWTHGMYGNESKLKLLLKEVQFHFADIVFTYGNYARELLIKQGLDGRKIAVIHNSLSYDKQLTLRKRMSPSGIYFRHFGNENPVLIFIGRLTEVKKLYLLVEAVDILKHNGSMFNLVLVGDGIMGCALKREVSIRKLDDQVWFYGESFNEENNSELLFNADICVSPGNVGLTAMHSMMYGCPVISHDSFMNQGPEFEAIHEGETGSFFKYGDAESLAECISKWFLRLIDRNSVRQSCFDEIDNYWTPSFQMSVFQKYIETK